LSEEEKAEIEESVRAIFDAMNTTEGDEMALAEKRNSELREQILALLPDANVEGVEDTEELMSRLTDAEIAAGTVWWRKWWVPDGVANACEYAFFAAGAFAPATEAGGESCGAWMRLLAETIRRSSTTSSSPADDGLPRDTNAFPVLLLALAVARQGHLEAVAVYTMARTLGTLNAQAISQYEGVGSTVACADEKVSKIEGSNTLPSIAAEVGELLAKEAAPYLFGIFFLSALFLLSVAALPILLLGSAWYASSVGLTNLFDFLFYKDPLDFDF